MKKLVIEWYMETYPADPEGEEIDSNITFEQLEKTGFAYAIVGDVDSIVRERIMEELSKRLGVDYDAVYERWLANENLLEMAGL